jgi:hypothetical protein
VILRRISAKGFMRYQALDLADLPREGAIAILGENESGKTTIGECIAFALFGETIKSRATDISQVVSWDAEEASVAVEFDASGAAWRVERRADKRGAHEARLEREGTLVAEGPDEVLERIRGLTGLTFEEFRATFYLAQAELGLIRRGDAEGDGRRAILEILGVGALERAVASTRAEIVDLSRRAEALASEHAVADALARAEALPPGFGAELDRERAELEAEAARAREVLPAVGRRIESLKQASLARSDAIAAFARLEAALLRRRADLAAQAAGKEIAELAAGLAAEKARLERELAHRGRLAEEKRGRVDRLIEYQAKMAELAARVELYRLEVKRALEAPELEAEDVAALEGLALPSSAAAGLKLSEARVAKLRRSRNRATTRAAVFFLLACLLGVFGLPALAHVWPQAAAATGGGSGETGLAAYLERVVARIADPGTPRERGIWLAFALAGCGGALLFLVLSGLQLRHSLSRSDSLKLAAEARERLAGEVKALDEEREKLERLDLKKPLRFAEAVKELRNPALREVFEGIREAHNDFIESAEQRDELVAKERREESKLRAEAALLEGRLARVNRLLGRLPPPGSSPDVPAGAAAAAPIP